MKKLLYLVLPVLIFIFTLTSPSFAAPSAWPLNSGMVCWEVWGWVVEEGQPPVYAVVGHVKAAVRRILGKNYIIIGKNIEGDSEQYFNGNAEIIDGPNGVYIVINISSAGYMPPIVAEGDPGDRHGFLGTLELDEDINGTLRGLEINATPYGVSPEEFKVQSASDKDLVLIPCNSIED